MRGEPNWLPIPFPRYFTPKSITENGRIMQQQTGDKNQMMEEKEKLHDEFCLSFPTLVKLTQDGSYQEKVEWAYNDIKTMKLPVKVQLLKEAFLEQDELNEIKENLANLAEEYKTINFDSENEDDDSGDEY